MLSIMTVACLYIWLRTDEAALDYSSLNIEATVSDPAINGYTALREFSSIDDNERSTLEEVEVLFDLQYLESELNEISVLLNKNQDWLQTLEKVFERPVFQFDLPATPEAIIPELSDIRIYVTLKSLRARELALTGNQDLALEELFELHRQITTYTQCGGPLIPMLIALKARGLLEQEFSKFMTHTTLSPDKWESATTTYQLEDIYAAAVSNAFKQEFHFSTHCLTLLIDEPVAIIELTDAEASSAATRTLIHYVSPFFFKENRTKNTFYLSYSEIAEQAAFPLQLKQLDYSESLLERMEDSEQMTIFSRNALGNLLIAMIMPTHQKVLEHVCAQQASSCATQLSFALKSYYQDNEQLPNALSELVPQYIATIPKDPFDGEPMRYSKDRAIIYSVGTDFIDNGGSDVPFRFTLDEYDSDVAETDKSEPTFPLRFAM